jgi:hypothetical protein
MTGAGPQPPRSVRCPASPPAVPDTARYDVAVDTDVDPSSGVAFYARLQCRCRSQAAPDGCPEPGHLAAVSLPVGDCRTVVYSVATGHGSWRLLICRFPGQLGAGAALMDVTEQLRHALRHARLTPTYIAASPAPGSSPLRPLAATVDRRP